MGKKKLLVDNIIFVFQSSPSSGEQFRKKYGTQVPTCSPTIWEKEEEIILCMIKRAQIGTKGLILT